MDDKFVVSCAVLTQYTLWIQECPTMLATSQFISIYDATEFQESQNHRSPVIYRP
ncbi:MAG: hypothetical protein MUO26_00515 [Methanotrichaceae archaeon]|nr:hypothetical protein [Methanotrichaceae archaeon]